MFPSALHQRRVLEDGIFITRSTGMCDGLQCLHHSRPVQGTRMHIRTSLRVGWRADKSQRLDGVDRHQSRSRYAPEWPHALPGNHVANRRALPYGVESLNSTPAPASGNSYMDGAAQERTYNGVPPQQPTAYTHASHVSNLRTRMVLRNWARSISGVVPLFVIRTPQNHRLDITI